MKKILCELCNTYITACNYSKHQRRHKVHPETFIQYHLDHDDLFCKFCGKECKNKNSLIQHELRCKCNLNQINVYTKGFNVTGSYQVWNKGLTKDDPRVLKQVESRKKTLLLNPSKNTGGFKSYSYSPKYKYGTYKGYFCNSSWELAFIIYCIDHQINVKRNTSIYFEYELNNKLTKFYPDFIIDNTFYEIKGGYDPNTALKVAAVPFGIKLVLIDIDSIDKYLNYAKLIYGENFTSLYDKNFPSWMDKN